MADDNSFCVEVGTFICFLIFLNNCLSHSLPSPFNCSNYPGKDDFNLPNVQVYDAAEEIPNYAKNGTVILEPALYEGNTLGWIGLECNHSKAIRWVYNLNILQAGLADTYSVTARDVKDDFYDTNSYEFRAEVELQIHGENLNFVLMCVSFENPCERSIAEVNYDKNEKKYILKSLPKNDENIPLVAELERAMVKNSNWGQTLSQNSSCEVKFSLFDEGESDYHHLWIPQSGNKIDPRRVPDRQNLENIYLFSDHLSRVCITDICRANKSSCNNAKKDSEKNKYWPLTFFMAGGKNRSRVVHAYQTLVTRNHDNENGPGRLKFAWEYSNPEDFLVLEELGMDGNSIIYMGQEITIRCHMSPFLFSFGTKIGYLPTTASTDNINFIDTEEDTVINATRVAFGKFTFPFSSTSGKIRMYCFAPMWNSSTEWVNVSREYELVEPMVEVQGTGIKSFVLSLNTAFNTSCKAFGSPLPFLGVTFPTNTTRVQLSETIGNNSRQIDLTIDAVDESHTGFYKCVATNFRGTSFYEFEIKIKTLSVSEASMSTLTIALISVFGSVSAIFLAVVIFLLVRFRLEKAEFRRLTEEAVREFFEGLDAVQVPTTGDGSDQPLYANDRIKAQPYNKKYEVSHKNWSLTSTILGSGAFGIVRKGCVEIGGRKSVVAVKTMKSEENDIDDFKATLLELKILSTIGNHRHIVKLVAASTDEIQNRKVFIGVEFCANGSLLTYLQKRKKLFTNLVSDGRIQFQINANKESETPKVEEGAYMNLVTSDISTIDLFKWSFQIASGMDFLESKKVLHADLAARNILLTDELLVKISDFGLSRELFENSEYTKKTQVVLPFKWMAPESLKWLKFSIKSDVWSYGVTLHEVFTLGDEPYPGLTWNEDFITMLENGMRLERPPFCTENVYTQVMMRCWQAEPHDRIRFADAMSFFEKAIGFLTSSSRNGEECRDFC